MNRNAFSMIEVLIAIVVLAIGLLGLAITLPATITVQRRGAEATRAISAASAAQTYIKSRPDLVRLHSWDARVSNPFPPRQPMGFGTLVEDDDWSPSRLGAKLRYAWDNTRSGKLEVNGDDVGQMEFNLGKLSTLRVYLNMKDRLWPDASIGRRPEFVWDFIARRVPARTASSAVSPKIEIAVFVRRIDPGIRVADGATLYQVLTNEPTTVPISDRRVPVAVGDNGDDVLPRLDGRGDYGAPFTMEVRYDRRDPERITIQRGGKSQSHLTVATQLGQKLVDNLGNVYRVVRVDETDPATVILSPPVPGWVSSTNGTDPDSLFQVALTPHIPITIDVFELTLTDPLSSPDGSGVRGMPGDKR